MFPHSPCPPAVALVLHPCPGQGPGQGLQQVVARTAVDMNRSITHPGPWTQQLSTPPGPPWWTQGQWHWEALAYQANFACVDAKETPAGFSAESTHTKAGNAWAHGRDLCGCIYNLHLAPVMCMCAHDMQTQGIRCKHSHVCMQPHTHIDGGTSH